MEQRYYLRFKGRVLGPLSSDKTMEMVKRGQITRLHELSPDGIEWRKADDFEELFPKKKSSSSTSTSAKAREAKPVKAKPSKASVEIKEEWYAHLNDEKVGPLEKNQMQLMVASGKINSKTLLWRSGMDKWQAAELLVPEWFTASGASQPVYVADEGELLPELCNLIRRRTLWMYIIAVTGIIVTSLGLLFGIFMFVTRVFSRADSGLEVASGLFVCMIGLAMFGWFFFCFVTLIRYANSASVLRHAPSEENVKKSLGILSAFWLYTGIFVLTALTIGLLSLIFLYAFSLFSFNSIFN